MIGSLRGRFAALEPGGDLSAEVIVDVGGVGYRVVVATPTVARLGPLGGDVELAVHTHVRESAITLYGFSGAPERRCFELLLGAHGVGPALALSLLGCFSPDDLAAVAGRDDVDALTVVPGIGKKTATRLIVELRARFGADGVRASSNGTARPSPASAIDDTAQALGALGYAPTEVRDALRNLPDGVAPEELLRLALLELAPRP